MGFRAQHVFRWDLDKTYLRTEFDSVRDLLKSAMESASDKVAYPGAAALLRSLRKTTEHRICIVSGSPSQMRSVLSAKLALDGIEFDEFVLKNNLRNLAKLRFRALRSQIPYKLPALLESRSNIIGDAKETLFGDDAEADGVIYSLYGDIVAGRVDEVELHRTLLAVRAYPDQIERTMDLAKHLRGRGDVVQRIFIHLDKGSPTDTFRHLGQRLVPIHNYFQASLVLYEDNLLTAAQILFVADEMLSSNDFHLNSFADSMQDLMRRGRLLPSTVLTLCEELESVASGSPSEAGEKRATTMAHLFGRRAEEIGVLPPIEWPDQMPSLDYVALVAHESKRKRSDDR